MEPKYNPCSHCKVRPIAKEIRGRAYRRCPQCRSTSIEKYWNEANPLNVADLEQQLTECHQLLETVAMSSYVDYDIRKEAEALLAKHQAN